MEGMASAASAASSGPKTSRAQRKKKNKKRDESWLYDPSDDLPVVRAETTFLQQFTGSSSGFPEPKDTKIYNKKRLRKTIREIIAKAKEEPPTKQNEYNQKKATCIVVAETGSGKSTQIPVSVYRSLKTQYPKINCLRVIITQPRRLAATTLAQQVEKNVGALETGEVSHSVRFDTNFDSAKTRLHYVTEGILLQALLSDPYLLDYQVVIVDEAHERSITTDIILGHLKKLVYYRWLAAAACKKEIYRLRLVVMSATAEAETFKSFFPGSKMLYIEGRAHTVMVQNPTLGSPQSFLNDYLSAAASIIMHLHTNLPITDHFLVFLTGQEEIELVLQTLRNWNKAHLPLLLVPLYAALSRESQNRAFDIPPFGTRKVVIATNIAETSLTIPGIKVVIDSGYVKSKFYLSSHSLEAYQIRRVAKSQADQRAGRAGRESDGVAYRLYTKLEHAKMDDYELPEISRSDLIQLELIIHNFNLDGAPFQFLTAPKPEVVDDAQTELKALKLMSQKETEDNRAMLTKLGKSLSRFPVEPKLAAVVYRAGKAGVLEQVCSIVGLLESENIFLPPLSKNGGFIEREAAPEGDLITYWKIYRGYSKASSKLEWCKQNRISHRALVFASKVKKQLIEVVLRTMEERKMEYKAFGDPNPVSRILSVFGETIFWNRAKLDRTGRFYIVERIPKLASVKENLSGMNLVAKIHPSSSLAMIKPPQVFFLKVILNERNDVFLQHVSVYEAVASATI